MVNKQIIMELIMSGKIRGFLPPELTKYEFDVQEMGTYTGIVLHNRELKEAAYPVFNIDRVMEHLKYCNSEAEAAELLAGMMNRFMEVVPNSNSINIKDIREKLSNYESAKPYIFMDAVPYKYNNDRAIVYEQNGMKFVPKIMLSKEEARRVVSPVSKDWLAKQNISEEQLICDAISNTERITSSTIKPIVQMLDSYNFIQDSDVGILDNMNMIVLTNESKTGGASLILNDNQRQMISKMYNGADFYVLPSSIHEVITLPVDSFYTPDSNTLQSLMAMVSEVNETLDDEEILGYNISIYDAQKRSLEKATDYCINKQINKVRELRLNELKEIGRTQIDSKPDLEEPGFNM